MTLNPVPGERDSVFQVSNVHLLPLMRESPGGEEVITEDLGAWLEAARKMLECSGAIRRSGRGNRQEEPELFSSLKVHLRLPASVSLSGAAAVRERHQWTVPVMTTTVAER